MTCWYHLDQKRQRLKQQINDNLDILIGSVCSKGPQDPKGCNLTFKVNGKSKGRHIRKPLIPTVREMTKRHQKLKQLIQELSDVNWELLKQSMD
ncbi:MAG: hypothetical protein AMJ65_16815 [Phycisphaerae bacterium SG8_4]|nr:MAG: hypothetical protein AMJ65_16815 [Phycisphaerae bacterium SG8_4]